MPRVSVLTSCYNAACYLPEAIESILRQTMADLEYILIDDGSMDDTLQVIERYAAKDGRIAYVTQENRGPAAARNAGITMATGDWVAVIDADDVALPERLERQLAYVEARPSTLLLGSGCIEIDSSGRRIKEHRYPSDGVRLVRRMETFRKFPPHSSILYHGETVKQLGGFDPRFVPSEDADLWLRLSEIGNLACVPQPLVRLRKHSAGISRQNRGMTQRLMGMAARVCHFLRLQRAVDPSSADENTWAQFLDWLARKLEDEPSSGKWVRWADIRQEWYVNGRTHASIGRLRLALDAVLSGYGIWALRHRLFGSRLPVRLAHEWMEVCTRQQCADRAANSVSERQNALGHRRI